MGDWSVVNKSKVDEVVVMASSSPRSTLRNNKEMTSTTKRPTSTTHAAKQSLPRPSHPIKPPTKGQSKETEEHLLITSDPYTLEEFGKHFQLPQMVRVYSGYYGSTEQFSISEGEELILYFIKSTKAVKASTQSKSESYYLPLNSLLQFSYYDIASTSNARFSHHYKKVRDLIQRNAGLPKIVKVLKSIYGLSEETSVSEGDVVFPMKVSGKGNDTTLWCTNKDRKVLKLNQSCVGNFSTDPSDIRMYLHEYIEHVNEFPALFLIFGGQEQSKNLRELDGTVLVLEGVLPFRSYICSTEIFGKSDYSIIELPMAMPIQIQRMERPSIYMQPIYHKVRHTYENFNPSMVKRSMYPVQSLEAQKFYEQLTKDNRSSPYELERPQAIYENIPGEKKVMKQIPSIVPVASPPLPARRIPIPVNPSGPSLPPTIPLGTVNTKPSRVTVIPSEMTMLPDNKESTQNTVSSVNNSPYPITTSTPEENTAYLKMMDVETVLQLLDDMNLAEYKASFQHEQVDGELLVALTKDELEDLGVTKKIHQLRLLKLIDGSSSAKKYEGGLYCTFSKSADLVHK